MLIKIIVTSKLIRECEGRKWNPILEALKKQFGFRKNNHRCFGLVETMTNKRELRSEISGILFLNVANNKNIILPVEGNSKKQITRFRRTGTCDPFTLVFEDGIVEETLIANQSYFNVIHKTGFVEYDPTQERKRTRIAFSN